MSENPTNSLSETTPASQPLDAPQVVFTKTGRADWLNRLADDAQRDVMRNARDFMQNNPDRRNPLYHLYAAIAKQAALLDEQEAKINQLEASRR
jgi:hypothetical protein